MDDVTTHLVTRSNVVTNDVSIRLYWHGLAIARVSLTGDYDESNPIAQFIYNFDQGKYPDLVEWS